MSDNSVRRSPVPPHGPLTLGAVYQRTTLHKRFGGNNTAGIVPSKSEPVVLLFHTEEGTQQFYGDGFDTEGVYWYSGMGALGDMEWNYANRAVRDHLQDGRDLYLFERAQRQGGLWRLAHLMHCIGLREESRRDRKGVLRRAFVFGLVPVEEGAGPDEVMTEVDTFAKLRLHELRRVVSANGEAEGALGVRVTTVYLRSAAVRAYALTRAGGSCEACLEKAPFLSTAGLPFLEVHHLDRLADGGPDRPERVAGLCPNCHRRCHYGRDGAEYNDRLKERVAARERELGSLL